MVHTVSVRGMHFKEAMLAISAMLQRVQGDEMMEVVGGDGPDLERALRYFCQRENLRQVAISRRGSFLWLLVCRV